MTNIKQKVPQISGFSIHTLIIGLEITTVLFLSALIISIFARLNLTAISAISFAETLATVGLKTLVMTNLVAFGTDLIIKSQLSEEQQ